MLIFQINKNSDYGICKKSHPPPCTSLLQCFSAGGQTATLHASGLPDASPKMKILGPTDTDAIASGRSSVLRCVPRRFSPKLQSEALIVQSWPSRQHPTECAVDFRVIFNLQIVQIAFLNIQVSHCHKSKIKCILQQSQSCIMYHFSKVEYHGKSI